MERPVFRAKQKEPGVNLSKRVQGHAAMGLFVSGAKETVRDCVAANQAFTTSFNIAMRCDNFAARK